MGGHHDNHATSWPFLQAEIFKTSARLSFQDGPSVAIKKILLDTWLFGGHPGHPAFVQLIRQLDSISTPVITAQPQLVPGS